MGKPKKTSTPVKRLIPPPAKPGVKLLLPPAGVPPSSPPVSWEKELRDQVAAEFRITTGVGKGFDRKATLLPLDSTQLLLVLPFGCYDKQLIDKAIIVVEEFEAGKYRIIKGK